MKNGYLKSAIGFIEHYLPMTLSSFLIFIFIIYLFFLVGKSILTNYNSNKEIETEEVKLEGVKLDIAQLQNEINYYQTNSFKEKEARAKLGYKAPGENVLSLPLDKIEDRDADDPIQSTIAKVPNHILWWRYFFGKN